MLRFYFKQKENDLRFMESMVRKDIGKYVGKSIQTL